MLATKKIPPSNAGSTPQRRWNQYAMRLMGDEAAGERVEAEDGRQPEHDPARLVQSEEGPRGGEQDVARHLDGRGQAHEPEADEQPDDRVADDDGPVAVERRRAAGLEHLGEQARPEGADGARDLPGEVVPGKDAGAPVGGNALGERGLLDGQERPDLVAGRRDHADRRRDEQQQRVARDREDHPGAEHEQRPDDEHPAAARADRRASSATG